jgi:FtsH-binding integral membrane protein
MWGLVAAGLLQSFVLVVGASRGGVLSARRYLRETWAMVAAQMVITTGMLVVIAAIDTPLGLVCALGLGLVETLALLAIRRRTPVGRIAAARRLPGFGA